MTDFNKFFADCLDNGMTLEDLAKASEDAMNAAKTYADEKAKRDEEEARAAAEYDADCEMVAKILNKYLPEEHAITAKDVKHGIDMSKETLAALEASFKDLPRIFSLTF